MYGADGHGGVRALTVDADVRDLKAEQRFLRLRAQLRDLVKVTGCDIRLRADPAAADRVHIGRRDELAQILRVHAAGRDEADAAERAGQRLHRRQATVDICREELHHAQPQLHGCHDLRRRDAAGRYGDAVLDAPAHDLRIKARRHDEFRAARYGLLALRERDDRARADEHIRALLTHCADRIRRRRRAERDLHHIHAAGQKRPGGGDCIFRVVQHDDRHDAALLQSL